MPEIAVRKGLLVACAVFGAGLLMFSCLVLVVPGVLRPQWWALRWQLADGTVVRFYKMPNDPPGRDTIKCLEVTSPDSGTKTYPFATTHAGYLFVHLLVSEDGSRIWLVDWEARRVGCVLDLRTGQFCDELAGRPPDDWFDSRRVVPPVR